MAGRKTIKSSTDDGIKGASDKTLSDLEDVLVLISDSNSDIKTNLDSVISGDGIKKITAALPAGTNNIGISGANSKPSANITRSANATQYAINDVMNNLVATTSLPFTVSIANDKKGWVVGGKAVTSYGAAGTLPSVDLLLFSSNFAIAADNAAFAPSFANAQTYLGKIRFQTWVARGANMAESDGSVETPIQFSPATGTQIIYGVLVLQNTYTPASGETLQFAIEVEQY